MDEGFRERVKRFGLTEKEVETYAAILESGSATATEIAEQTDVSKRHVYNIARKLEDREFVVINDIFNPTTIEPAPPDEVYNRINEEASKIYRDLESQYQQAGNQEEELKVLKSRKTVIEKIEELISSAESRIAISIPADIVRTLRDSLEDAVERDVTVLLVLFEDPIGNRGAPDIQLEGLAHIIRYREIEMPVLAAIDRKFAFVSPRGAITQPNSQVNAIFLGQSYLESVVFSALINSDWINADEIYTARPNGLPHTYTNFRHSVIDAALHEKNGTDLRAEVEVRARGDAGDIIELSGEVVELNQRLVAPTSGADPGQCCMRLRADGETVTVGGKDAHMEDFRAYSTTLERAD